MEEKKKHVLITGGTSGIGYELAKLFAKDNYNIILVARDEQELKKIERELQDTYDVNVLSIATDLFDPENAFEIYEEVTSMGITLDVLVNNVGQGQYGEFADTDIRRELSIIQLNISSLIILTKLFLNDMIKRREGKILNLCSEASKITGPYQSVYQGTEAFVQSFTEAIRSEVKDAGVVITSILPGPTSTDFSNNAEMQELKIVQEAKLAIAAAVPKDGYDALMNNGEIVMPGFNNKGQVAGRNIMPGRMVADNFRK